MNKPLSKFDWDKIIDFFGLFSIGVFCFLYSLYTASFAEKHFYVSYIALPIFVGEVLLAVCAVLLFIKWARKGFPNNRWITILILYIFWILAEAVGPGGCAGGYGALSLRNAALFYYLLFGVFGYCFYEPKFFSSLITFSFMALLGLTLYWEMVNDYYWLAYVILFAILAIHLPRPWQRYGSLAAGLLFFTWHTLLFGSSRAHLIGVVAAVLFFILHLVFVFLPFRLRYKWLALAGLMVIFGLGVLRFADPNAIKSLTTPSRVIKQFKEWDAFVLEQEKTFVFEDLTVNLYNEKRSTVHVLQPQQTLIPHWGQKKTMLAEEKKLEEKKSKDQAKIPVKPRTSSKERAASLREAPTSPEFTLSAAEKNTTAMQHLEEVMQETSADAVPDETRNRSLGIAYGNMQFRLFIWRDMIEEWLASPTTTLFGVGFGKPQRSPSIEIIGWGKLEWRRTGWITPHNSYLHMIYRAGIVGLLVVAAIFIVLVRLIKDFARQKSLMGSLLVMCLIYWLFFAFFSLFFELPYTAIPFWTLLGMTIAYAYKGRNRLQENTR